MEKLSVIRFSNFRLFLNEHFEFRKRENPRFSVGRWATQLRLKDTSSLNKVLRGQRNPGSLMVENFVQYFQFNNKEANYFRRLVELEKNIDDLSIKDSLVRELEKMSPNSKFNDLELSQFSFFTKWYFVAIKEMIQLKDFRLNFEWLADRLVKPVSPQAIADAVDKMCGLGILKRADDTVTQTSLNVKTPKGISSQAIRNYHADLFELAIYSLKNIEVSKRHFSGLSLAIRESDLPRFFEKIEEFYKDINDEFESSSGDEIYHFSSQLFPLTQKNKRR